MAERERSLKFLLYLCTIYDVNHYKPNVSSILCMDLDVDVVIYCSLLNALVDSNGIDQRLLLHESEPPLSSISLFRQHGLYKQKGARVSPCIVLASTSWMKLVCLVVWEEGVAYWYLPLENPELLSCIFVYALTETQESKLANADGCFLPESVTKNTPLCLTLSTCSKSTQRKIGLWGFF